MAEIKSSATALSDPAVLSVRHDFVLIRVEPDLAGRNVVGGRLIIGWQWIFGGRNVEDVIRSRPVPQKFDQLLGIVEPPDQAARAVLERDSSSWPKLVLRSNDEHVRSLINGMPRLNESAHAARRVPRSFRRGALGNSLEFDDLASETPRRNSLLPNKPLFTLNRNCATAIRISRAHATRASLTSI